MPPIGTEPDSATPSVGSPFAPTGTSTPVEHAGGTGLNKAGLATDILAAFEKHTGELSTEAQQAAQTFLQELLAFLIGVITTGGGTLGPITQKTSVNLFGKTYTFNSEEKITASS